MHRHSARLAAAGAVLATLAVGLPAVAATARAGTSGGPPRYEGTSTLDKGWAIQSSALAGHDGAAISQPDYVARGWLPLSKPETLMAGLTENGRYRNVFYSDNLKKVPTKQFDVDWWYRDRLTVHPKPGQHTFLVMNGVSGKADLWVDGRRIADGSRLQGSYSRYEYDLTGLVRDGANAIALDVSRNDADITTFTEPMRYLTQNQVDWSPVAPDQQTGLQFAPQLAQDGPVSVRGAHVVQNDARDLSTADLTVKAGLRNNTGTARRATFAGTITHGRRRIACSATVDLPPHATRTVSITPANCSGLHLRHPAVWWPYQLGAQPMYHLAAVVTVHGGLSDRASDDFGVRTVTSGLTKVVPGKTIGKYGYRKFAINGVPLVVRGGGWSPDMFLRYSHRNIANQISSIKNLGLNTVRFEGNFPPPNMFDQLDRAGVLAMPGWQCCAKWEYPSKTWDADTKINAANQAATVAAELRDHPSVFAFWQGSDAAPDPVKESIYLTAFRKADWALPQVASANYESSKQLGPSGAKEGGYNYAPPDYYWANGPQTVNRRDPTLQMNGSAWGFDTETSSGNTIPTQDSLDRFLTPADQRKIWSPSTTKGPGSGPDLFHTFVYTPYTSLARMGVYNTALWHRYGPWTDGSSYEKTVQMGEYEVARAEFESNIGNSKDRANPSTGFIYWMLNKAWPSLQWSLYGTDYDQPGVYFGTKKANEPVHIMYDYAHDSIRVANLTGQRQSGLIARADWIDLDGQVRQTVRAPVRSLSTQDVANVVTASAPKHISSTYFLRLTLDRKGTTVSRNVYWLSTKPDVVDWVKTHAPGKYTPANGYATFAEDGYADLSGLRRLPQADVRFTTTTHRQHGKRVTTVTIRNVGPGRTPVVFLRADLFAGGHQILPVRWSDNDVTLWPGEQATLTARYTGGSGRPTVRIGGENVSPRSHD